MPVYQYNGMKLIGTLSVPAIGLETPVQQNWSYENLVKTPCRYCGSAYAGNFVIIAHTYASHFGSLKNLSVGSRVTFTDIDGNVFRYQVVERLYLNPDESDALANSGYDLTLSTCAYEQTKRLVVRCEKVK